MMQRIQATNHYSELVLRHTPTARQGFLSVPARPACECYFRLTSPPHFWETLSYVDTKDTRGSGDNCQERERAHANRRPDLPGRPESVGAFRWRKKTAEHWTGYGFRRDRYSVSPSSRVPPFGSTRLVST